MGGCDQCHQRKFAIVVLHWALVCFWGWQECKTTALCLHRRWPLPAIGEHMLQAQREGVEIVICDTSGRLHTNVSLMDELAKCKRAITKRMASAPHEVLLVLDGTTGGLRAHAARMH